MWHYQATALECVEWIEHNDCGIGFPSTDVDVQGTHDTRRPSFCAQEIRSRDPSRSIILSGFHAWPPSSQLLVGHYRLRSRRALLPASDPSSDSILKPLTQVASIDPPSIHPERAPAVFYVWVPLRKPHAIPSSSSSLGKRFSHASLRVSARAPRARAPTTKRSALNIRRLVEGTFASC